MKKGLLWLALFGAIFFLWVNVSRFGSDALSGRSPADFPNYYFAGKRLLENRPIYSDLAHEVSQVLGWHYTVYPADPPFTVALLTPLSVLPYNGAWWTLLALSLGCIAGGTFVASRLKGVDPLVAALLAVVSLLSMPALFLLKRNHMESILVPLSLGGWILLERKKDNAAMAVWGFAAALKLFPAIWILGCARALPKKTMLLGALWTVGLSAVGCLMVGLENSTTFFTETIPGSKQWYGVVGNLSLLSLGTALQGATLGALFEIAGFVAFLELLCSSQKINASRWLCVVAWSLLLSPLGWLNYWVLLIAPLIAVMYNEGDRRARIITLCWAVLLLYWPTSIETPSVLLSILLSNVPTFALLGLVGTLRFSERQVVTQHVRVGT